MSRNLTERFLRETQLAINAAVSITDVLRIARVVGGYHVTRSTVVYTESDRAWFKRSLGSV